MSQWNANAEEADSDEEEVDFFSGREAIIFVIDAQLYRDPVRFANALDTIQKSLLSGLLTRGKDFIGVVFFNTENSPDPKDMTRMKNVVVSKNSAVLLPLCELSKDVMDYFLNFTTPDYYDFQNRYGIQEGSLANGIRLCTNMFKQCGYKLSCQTIIYFTDCDEPHKEGTTDFQKCMQKAKDLDETDTQFEVLPMCDHFNYAKFYKEFLCMVQHIEMDSFIEPDSEELTQRIVSRNLQLNSKKRCTFHLKWILGNDVQISVGLYNYFKKNILPKSVKLLRSNNNVINVRRVLKVKTNVDNDGDAPMGANEEEELKPSDKRQILTVGGHKVAFTCEEVSRIRSPLAPGLRLLGFKGREAISLHNFIKTSAFLYPDENIINGSTKLFRALWAKCLERNQVAICVIVPRRKTSPRFVALLPTEKSERDHDGFRVTYLPFENELRTLNLQGYTNVEVAEESVKIFEKVCNKLKMKFSPDILKDPTLELLESTIVGSAFDIEYEGLGEGCSPNLEEQDKRIEKVVENLAEAFGTDMEIAKKRRANTTDKPNKIAKISDECPSEQQVMELLAKDELSVLTINQLKAYLKEKNVQGLSLTKPKLIEKVKELNA